MKYRTYRNSLGWITLSLLVLGGSLPLGQVYRQALQEQCNTTLIAAIKRNDAIVVRALLAQGADATARDLPPDKRSLWQRLLDDLHGRRRSVGNVPPALLVALNIPAHFQSDPPAYQDAAPIVKALLDRGANVNITAADGQPPLLLASEHEQWGSVKVLLDRGAPVNVADPDGETPLMLAQGEKQPAIVKALLDRGAQVNIQDRDGTTPLDIAAGVGDVQSVRYLLDRGANVNAHDVNWETPLMSAAWGGRVACVELLLKRGADINAEANSIGTALMHAVVEGHLSVVKLLVARGAKVNTSITPIVYNAKPTSPLSYARDSHRNDIVAVLKRAGAKE